jgi:hypothetical protein
MMYSMCTHYVIKLLHCYTTTPHLVIDDDLLYDAKKTAILSSIDSKCHTILTLTFTCMFLISDVYCMKMWGRHL